MFCKRTPIQHMCICFVCVKAKAVTTIGHSASIY